MVRPSMLLVLALIVAPPPADPPDRPAGDVDSVWIQVRTLVTDALGTRTVDTGTARVEFGQRGLLIGRVPYGGPPLSYRILVRADRAEGDEIPLAIVSEVWQGDPEPRPVEALVTRREETARIVPGTSYLLELAHEGVADDRSERRIMLSFTVTTDRPEVTSTARSARMVNFLLQVIRREGEEVDPPDTHALSSLEGRPVTYATAVRPAGGGETLGLEVTLTAERVAGDLITVRVRLDGAESPAADTHRVLRVVHDSRHTVRSGDPILVEARAAEVPPSVDAALPPVTYTVAVTPSLG